MSNDRSAKRGYPLEDVSIKPQTQGPTLRTPGSGEVSRTLGGHDARSIVHHADVMQAWVGGGTAEEHVYETDQTKKVKGNRRRQNRKDV